MLGKKIICQMCFNHKMLSQFAFFERKISTNLSFQFANTINVANSAFTTNSSMEYRRLCAKSSMLLRRMRLHALPSRSFASQRQCVISLFTDLTKIKNLSNINTVFSQNGNQVTRKLNSAVALGKQEPNKLVSPVCSWNEWDPLEEVIVGIPDNAVVPPLTPEVKACCDSNQWGFFTKNSGRYWSDVIGVKHWSQLQKEVTDFVRRLEQEGVRVRRPEPIDFAKEYSTPDFKSTGLYCCMPRDILLIVGDEIIEATMTWQSRFFEYLAYRPLIREYWRQGATWTAAPKPQAGSQLINQNYPILEKESSSINFKERKYVTTEFEPCFDAADFLRCGRDIFVQRSEVTNLAGIEWVRRHLAPRGIRVHLLTFTDPRPMHIDATFSFVRPGLALQNPDRPCDQADAIRAAGWKVINAPTPLISKDHQLWLGSKWLSMNTLMMSPDRVFVEAEETDLQDLFRANGVEPIPVSLRFANSIGGGFHCWTADIRRKGTLQSYFDWSKSV